MTSADAFQTNGVGAPFQFGLFRVSSGCLAMPRCGLAAFSSSSSRFLRSVQALIDVEGSYWQRDGARF